MFVFKPESVGGKNEYIYSWEKLLEFLCKYFPAILKNIKTYLLVPKLNVLSIY